MGNISVSAVGKVVGIPDTTLVRISVNGKAETFDEASKILLSTVKKVKEAIESVGIDRENITSRNFFLQQTYRKRRKDMEYFDSDKADIPDGVQYGQDLEFKFPNNNEILTELVNLVNGISSKIRVYFSFECSNEEELLDQALALASAKALRKAQIIAGATGCTLGKCVGNLGNVDCGNGYHGNRCQDYDDCTCYASIRNSESI